MAERKQRNIQNLKDLLRETENDPPVECNFDRIVTLIEKTKEMKLEEKRRSRITQDYFKQLREKIDESSTYLEKARKNLENINVPERTIPEMNTIDEYDTYMQKSDEDVDNEMTRIRTQLSNLEQRVSKFNEKASLTDNFYLKSMETLKTLKKTMDKEHK